MTTTDEEQEPEPEQEDEPQESAYQYKPGDMSVITQLVTSEMKMTMEEYTDFKEQNIDWQDPSGPHPTQGLKVARVVGNEVAWRLNVDRRERAEDKKGADDTTIPGEHDAKMPTSSYLEMLLWMSSVKNIWVATPKFIPVLQ